MKQMWQVFQMTRRHDPMVPWLMLLAFLGVVALSLLVGFLLDNWITGLIIGIGEKLWEFYWGPLIGGGTDSWFAFVLALVFLLFRPQGLFGERIIERV